MECSPTSLTVGGGYGYLTGRHGLTIDNVLAATVVVADARILRASKDENQDVSQDPTTFCLFPIYLIQPLTSKLFFAIRGGGSNFGIVTKFQFALHPIPLVCWSGFLFYTPDKLDALVRAAIKWKEEVMSVDDTALIALTQSPEDGSQVSSLRLYNAECSLRPVAVGQLCPSRSRKGRQEAVSAVPRRRSVSLDDVGLGQ
jgi:FAD/FMN-containing dehydrogenase